ncbi:5'-methylthioadenosine/S-adenosylhomocysteine nucleosidase family protein [Chitinophaga sp. 22620]|uniref:5'-methylthioadenosine/S-adenosylhomocysteine nucleosidase family protein n=1 Tax=Chitinophaga sp. 22620 TaxID=3453952 RepID=UPI003F83EE2C
MSSTIIILTAIPEEQDAVLNCLKDYEGTKHHETGTQYYTGLLPVGSGQVKVVVGKTNQTNVQAATETERAIALFRPSHIFYLGVAGGLKDVKVGDIVIGDKVIGYERGKAETEYKPRYEFAASSYDLEQAAFAFSQSPAWKNIASSLLNMTFHDEIKTYSGVIASGEKVLASEQATALQLIKKDISHALAVEMEGLGFLSSCRAHPEVKTLLIRGISDLINDKGEMDNKGSQPYAAQNAAAFLFGLLSNLSHQLLLPLTSQGMRERIFEIACKLYPRGLEDKGIWERAGGDLSVVMLQTQGKAQWISALRLVENGGGGDVSFPSLLQQMASDAPGNQAIAHLLNAPPTHF